MMNPPNKTIISFIALYLVICGLTSANETLLPLKNDEVPRTYESLWKDYDPRKEPLEIEILKEWEQEGVVLRVLRYRVGIFKGKKAAVAAIYAFPKGSDDVPGLLHIHGGGQYADFRAPLANAKRGYATISIAWAGRINAPGYIVNPDVVELFWNGKTQDPKHKLTTDWGALDAYHSPSRNLKNDFQSLAPESWTLDPIESPRNSPWFLCTLAARRALTFLEQQPEVNPKKLGVYGHSMGGKITVMTAGSDSRVKAAAPSCGGMSDRVSDNRLYRATIGDDNYLRHITCPIIFLSPVNDFHGRIDDLQTALGEIKTKDWRVTCSPHHNHQDTHEYQVVGSLWFDQYLKADFSFPNSPALNLTLNHPSGIPFVRITADDSKRILAVDVFHTRHGQAVGEKDDPLNTKTRFWHHTSAIRSGDDWAAELPLFGTDKPLWVYANVRYALGNKVQAVGYYFGSYDSDEFVITSPMSMATPNQLQTAGVKSTLKPSLLIEDFENDWKKEWFNYDEKQWTLRTYKINDPIWQAPEGAKLAFEVKSDSPNKLVIGLDTYATQVELRSDTDWQEIILSPEDFQDAHKIKRVDWNDCRELRIGPHDTLKSNRDGKEIKWNPGATWKGKPPEFRKLRWIK